MFKFLQLSLNWQAGMVVTEIMVNTVPTLKKFVTAEVYNCAENLLNLSDVAIIKT